VVRAALIPCIKASLVIHHRLHLLGELDQLILGVFKIVFLSEGFKNVIKRLLLQIDPHLAKGILLFLQRMDQLDHLLGESLQHFAAQHVLLVALNFVSLLWARRNENPMFNPGLGSSNLECAPAWFHQEFLSGLQE